MRLSLTLTLLARAACAAGTLAADLVDALDSAVDCASCHALLVPLQGLAIFGDTAFSRTIATVCKTLKIQDPDVCDGALAQQGPILAHDLRSFSALGETAAKFCDAIFGLCPPPRVNPFPVPFPKPAPSLPTPVVSPARRRPPLQVVHFSDAHIDREYTPGADANCTKPICCRHYPDHSGPISLPAGPIASRRCDASTLLTQSMLRALPPATAFSIFTGDVVEASVWLLDRPGVTRSLETFNDEMSTILGAPVYPVIGNHESAPVNSFPRTGSSHSAQWVFDTQSQGWSKWINATGAHQVAHFSGSYAAVVPGTMLRIISINNVYWYKQNFWLYDSDNQQPDPNGILAFTVQELQAAEDAGQRAWIIAHMPPGRPDVMNDQSNYFDQIVQRYRTTIAGQFYGHTHQDQFAIAYSDYEHRTAENAVSVAWVAPSLTPRDRNPAFKVYDVDPDTYEIMDARVFISDLASPTFQTNPTWELSYSARATYGPLVPGLRAHDALGPAFWHEVTAAFAVNDTAFRVYQAHRARGAGMVLCEGECKRLAICGLRALRAQDNCDQAGRTRYFGAKGEGEGEGDECEGVGAGRVLKEVGRRLMGADRALLRRLVQEIEREVAEALEEEAVEEGQWRVSHMGRVGF